MNKKIVKILSIFLVLISISTMCYAGFTEVNISEEIQMDFLKRIEVVFGKIIDAFFEVFFGLYVSDYIVYIRVGIILIYAILNILIIKKKKDLVKISLKINAIILLILLVISLLLLDDVAISSLNELPLIFTPLIISLIFQKHILKKDDEKIKKYNCILKIIMVVLIIIEFVMCAIVYTVNFLIPEFDFIEILTGEVSLHEYMFGGIDEGDPILVESIYADKHYMIPPCYKEKWTAAEGEEIWYISEDKVLDIDEEGVLLQYTEYDYVLETEGGTVPNRLNFIFNANYKTVSKEKEIKLKWNTWYEKREAIDPSSTYNGNMHTYIRVIKNK